MAMVSKPPARTTKGAVPDVMSETARALPVLRHPGKLSDDGKGVLVCSGRLAILAESPKPQGKNHEGEARNIPTGLPPATAQDNPLDLKPAG